MGGCGQGWVGACWLVALPVLGPACADKGHDSGIVDSGVVDSGATDGGAGDGGAAAPASCDEGAAAVIGASGFWTVDDAVSGAVDDDTVTVCAGTHAVALSVAGLRLSLVGATGNSDDVVLTPAGSDPVINVGAGSDLWVADLVIADVPEGDTAAVRVAEASLALSRVSLRDNAGGGVRVQAGSGASASLTVESCTLTGNRTTAPGGAIATTGGGRVDLTVQGSSLLDNQGDLGGAIYVGSGSGTVVIGGSELSGNTAASLGGGFASLIDDGDLTVSDCELSANQARDGGGVFISERAERTTLRITDSILADNSASQQGGALYLGASDSSFSLSALSIEGNGAGDGGALYLMGEDGTTVTLGVEDTILRGNRASRSGGAVAVVSEGLTGSITLAGGGIDGNESADAAFALDGGMTLDSDAVDWGQGKLDNLPADLMTALLTWDDLGPAASFSCDATGACTR